MAAIISPPTSVCPTWSMPRSGKGRSATRSSPGWTSDQQAPLRASSNWSAPNAGSLRSPPTGGRRTRRWTSPIRSSPCAANRSIALQSTPRWKRPFPALRDVASMRRATCSRCSRARPSWPANIGSRPVCTSRSNRSAPRRGWDRRARKSGWQHRHPDWPAPPLPLRWASPKPPSPSIRCTLAVPSGARWTGTSVCRPP